MFSMAQPTNYLIKGCWAALRFLRAPSIILGISFLATIFDEFISNTQITLSLNISDVSVLTCICILMYLSKLRNDDTMILLGLSCIGIYMHLKNFIYVIRLAKAIHGLNILAFVCLMVRIISCATGVFMIWYMLQILGEVCNTSDNVRLF